VSFQFLQILSYKSYYPFLQFLPFKMSKGTKALIVVKSDGLTIPIAIDVKMSPTELDPIIKRCVADAVILAKITTRLNEQRKQDEEDMQCDMKKLRPFLQHKGDFEESLMLTILKTTYNIMGYNVTTLGFPLDEKDEIESDDILFIGLEKKPSNKTTKP